VGDEPRGWTRPRPGVAGPDEDQVRSPWRGCSSQTPQGLSLEGLLRMGILAGLPSFDRQPYSSNRARMRSPTLSDSEMSMAVRNIQVMRFQFHLRCLHALPCSTLPPAGSSVQAAAGPSSDALKKKFNYGSTSGYRVASFWLGSDWPASL
jgi:hypothetical protein